MKDVLSLERGFQIQLAEDPATPIEVLEELAKSQDLEVLAGILANPKVWGAWEEENGTPFGGPLGEVL